VTLVFVPEAAELSESEWREAISIVDRALSARPASVRRQIGLFLHVLDLLAVVRHGRSLASLSIDRRARLLESLARSRLLVLRRGIWGLRTLAFMGYYARPDAAARIGYGASAAGWSGRVEGMRR
jgi:hypothetical protein